jgi:putative spermidine/putrescine transport system permease protein
VNAIAAIPPSLEECSAALGAGRFETFLKVVLPLSLPGLGAGAILVFTLTSSSFVMPSILGGDFAKMLGTLVEEQLLAVSDWPFGAAIATILMLLNLLVVLGYMFLVERRVPSMSGRRT